jgi:predicted nucleotidyltransferase
MAAFGLSDKSLETLRRILSSCPAVEKALIYGSRAKGQHKHGSDIDITLLGHALNPDMLTQLMGLFDESNLPYMVDLSIHADIDNPALRDHIARVGQVIYQRDLV